MRGKHAFMRKMASDLALQGARAQVLHPGDVVCAQAGERLQTLLGSCVSICMTDVARQVGAMCHYVYCGDPKPTHRGDTTYADPALRRMFAELRAHGVDPMRCEAYVCGGGSLLPLGATLVPCQVGERNVRWARDVLSNLGIVIHELSVGGPCYRKVNWLVGQGAPDVQAMPMERGR